MKSIAIIVAAVVLMYANEQLVHADTKTPLAPKSTVPSTNAVKPSVGVKPAVLTPGVVPRATGDIHLNPAYFPQANVPIAITSATVLKDCYILQNTANADSAITDMTNVAQSCRTRAYSPRDQHLAGCLPTDTLAQCQPKLYRYCMTHNNEEVKLAWDRGILGGYIMEMEKCYSDLTQFKAKVNSAIQVYGIR